MDKPVSNFHFRVMSFGFKFRDLFSPRINTLKEVGIRPGFHVLDYGCGSGSYIKATAELVGEPGKIYALDIHPLAMRAVQGIALKNRLTNVETIYSDCETGLADNSIDMVLLYDTFYKLSNPDRVLEELHRVLKPEGVLSFNDHHMDKSEIVAEVTNKRLFRLLRLGERTYSFAKREQ